MPHRYVTKVAGVTYNNRQSTLIRMKAMKDWSSIACRVEAEPDNSHDPNALAVQVALKPGVIEQVGYIPRDLAAILAPILEGEPVMVTLLEITGGYETFYGGTASLGLLIQIDVHDRME